MGSPAESLEDILEKNLPSEELNKAWRILYGEDHPSGYTFYRI